MNYRVIMALATGLYTGYLPKAPGTWGSLVALPIHFGLSHLSPAHHGLALAAILLLAVWTAGSAEKILDRPDPQVVVIDEIVGMLIVLAGSPNTIIAWLLGFLLFRLFDILKPWPVSFCDRNLHGGLGIVLDDVLAGLYALLSLRALLLVMPS